MASIDLLVIDEYGQWEPEMGPLDTDGVAAFEGIWTIELIAKRKGYDRDGR